MSSLFKIQYTVPFFFFLLLPFPAKSQPAGGISLGSSLTAASNFSWQSPSGDFAFGFQEINSTQSFFLLAIWFNRIPERTVVWSANRNDPVPAGSRVQLTADGLLTLTDPSGRSVWSSNSGGAPVSYAAMLDTGSFILAGDDSSSLWSSFDQPTDTMLPTQSLNRGGELVAKYSGANHSSGRFKLTLGDDGVLVMYTTDYPAQENGYSYWSTGALLSGDRVTFNQSGSVSLIAKNGTLLKDVFGDTDSESYRSFYRRATMDSDGVFRAYIYPKEIRNSSSSWPAKWSSLAIQPPNICTSIRGTAGGGACGVNSYCQMENGSPSCKCPPGYVFFDPSDESKGCIKNFASHDCRGEPSDENQFVMMELVNTNWPDFYYEYQVAQAEASCREACLSDCFCDVAIFLKGFCWKKRMPLTNGRMDGTTSEKALVKVGRSNSSTSFPCPKKRDGRSPTATGRKHTVTVRWLLIGSSSLVNLLLLSTTVLFFSRWRRNNQRGRQLHPSSSTTTTSSLASPASFSYGELESATAGFKEVLGRGASATVYKGLLQNGGDGKLAVAVKKMDRMGGEGEVDDREFTTEVKVIAGTNHRNLVKLVGVCSEGRSHRLLVYEYMSNGSLASLLFKGETRVSWYTRMEIVYAVARGLVYLHEECSTQIIHCDIKPHNILLDESMTAKISDFGLAKLMKVNQTRTTTAIRGTKGYVAPEWFKNVAITTKVDVYSFGIVLLELVCCRRSFEMDGVEEEEMILVDWVSECYSEGNVRRLVEKDVEAMEDLGTVERLVKVGLWCIQEDPGLRPVMKKVIHMLEGVVDVFDPPGLASYVNTI